jgi:hypothetical protein
MSQKNLPLPLNLDTFAQGGTRYLDHYPKDDQNVRIVVTVYLADQAIPIYAIVDCGAPWCVLDPLEFEKVAHRADPVGPLEGKLNIRGLSYTGQLYRIPINFDTILGEAFEVEGTFFVPDVPEGELWRFPNFLGSVGLLNRIRWAVDPDNNLFFFGPLW